MGEATPATLNLPTGLGGRGQELPPLLAVNEPPAVCCTASSTPHTDFALGAISPAYPPLSTSTPGPHSSRSCHQPSGQMGLEDTLCSAWRCDSEPCLDTDKQGSRAGKILRLMTQIRQICTLPRSLVRLCRGSADKQSRWLGLLLGPCRCELSLPRTKCRWSPSLLFCHSQIPGGWALRVPCNLRGGRSEYGLPQRDPQHWGEAAFPHWFSFLAGGTGCSRGTSPRGAGLSWKRGNAVDKQPLLFPFQCNLSWSLSFKGPLQPHPVL